VVIATPTVAVRPNLSKAHLETSGDEDLEGEGGERIGEKGGGVIHSKYYDILGEGMF
jgi:hypothetical protein